MIEEKIEIYIGKDVFAKGNLTIIGSIRIDGTLQGNLTTTDTIIVSEGGNVNGEIIARDAVINGTVTGNLTATSTATLNRQATLNGDLYTAKVTLSEGSKFNGKCTMIKRKDIIVDQKTKDVKVVDLSPEEILSQVE